MKQPIKILLLILMCSFFAVKASENSSAATLVEQLETHRFYNRENFYYTHSIKDAFDFITNKAENIEEYCIQNQSKPNIMFVIDLFKLQRNKKTFDLIINKIPDLHILIDISNAQTIGHYCLLTSFLPDNIKHLHLIATKNNVRSLGINSNATQSLDNAQNTKSLKTLEICIPSLRKVSSDVLSAFAELETVRIYGDGFYMGSKPCFNTSAVLPSHHSHLYEDLLKTLLLHTGLLSHHYINYKPNETATNAGSAMHAMSFMAPDNIRVLPRQHMPNNRTSRG